MQGLQTFLGKLFVVCMSSDDALYFYKFSGTYLDRFATYKAETKLLFVKLQKGITPKKYRQELHFL